MWKVVEAADESLREVRSHYQENIKIYISSYYSFFMIIRQKGPSFSRDGRKSVRGRRQWKLTRISLNPLYGRNRER